MSPAPGRRLTGVEGRDPSARVVLVRDGSVVASWPLPAARCDLGVVDDLARLRLAARRVGCSVQLDHAGAALSELLDLCGLADVVAGDRSA